MEVLEAAGTKWNFLPFRPGLVGGHCIGVDPYYLTHKAEEIGYHPEVILAGRRINDSMGKYVVSQLLKAMIKNRINMVDAKVLILGLTFKENCPDIRNTKVIDIREELLEYGMHVDSYDPWVSSEDVPHEYGFSPVATPTVGHYDAIIIAVAHYQFKTLGTAGIRAFAKANAIVYDLKNILPKADVELRL